MAQDSRRGLSRRRRRRDTDQERRRPSARDVRLPPAPARRKFHSGLRHHFLVPANVYYARAPEMPSDATNAGAMIRRYDAMP